MCVATISHTIKVFFVYYHNLPFDLISTSLICFFYRLIQSSRASDLIDTGLYGIAGSSRSEYGVMVQRQRTSRWPFLALLTCLFVLGAVLPHTWERIARLLDDTSPQADNIFHKIELADDTPVVSYPTVEEIIQSATPPGSIPQAVTAEPSAAILSQVSAPDVPDDETENSLSITQVVVPQTIPELAPETIPEAAPKTATDTTSKTESEIAPQTAAEEDVVDAFPSIPEPSPVPQPSKEQSSAITTKSESTKKEPALVAHLPSLTKTLPEIPKPEQLDINYPNTGLEPLESQISPKPDQSKSKNRTLKPWSEPTALLILLDDLAKSKESSDWAGETAQLARQLGPEIARNPSQADSILDRLAKSSAAAVSLADNVSDWSLARKMRQAAFAIQRRLEIWRAVVKLGVSSLVKEDMPKLDPRRLYMCLAEMDHITSVSAEGKQWREYLLLDSMKDWSLERSQAEADHQRNVARQVLSRMTQTPMSVRQRQFISSKPVAIFCAELRRWAAEPITPADVLRNIERYEQTRLSSDAQRLGNDLHSLAQSSDPQRRELARQVETHYRNANLRISLSEDMVNRLVPEQNMELAPVRDTVLGLPVRGQSLTSTDVTVRLIPDPTHVRLALEVTGEVVAMTSSTSGPATFYNDSDSLYAARKPLEIDQKGIRLMPAEVDVHHQTRLRDVATDYDGIPLIGMMARSVARTQHEQAKPEANREARRKVADKARQRIDAEAQKRLSEMVDRLNRNLFGPLVNLSLEPTMIEAQTTQQRMTMRLRVAGEDQLGSHTPRPQAPADNLASFQINESLLNNALQRLQLEGKTFTLPQLVQRISQRFQRPDLWQVKPENKNATITFAKKDAVTVRCQDGQIVLTISIAEMNKEPRQWNDFQVRVFYRPQVDGRSIELVRDGVVHLIGPNLINREQIALRGIFSKAFSKNDTVKLTPERLLEDPKLQDLAISQFVIDDGWIGVSVGRKEDALITSKLPTTRK